MQSAVFNSAVKRVMRVPLGGRRIAGGLRFALGSARKALRLVPFLQFHAFARPITF